MRRDDRRGMDGDLLRMDSESRCTRDRLRWCRMAGDQNRFRAADSVAHFSQVAGIRPET